MSVTFVAYANKSASIKFNGERFQRLDFEMTNGNIHINDRGTPFSACIIIQFFGTDKKTGEIHESHMNIYGKSDTLDQLVEKTSDQAIKQLPCYLDYYGIQRIPDDFIRKAISVCVQPQIDRLKPFLK